MMVNDFPFDIGGDKEDHATAPDSFSESKCAILDEPRKQAHHTFVAKGSFACKRARPDIHPAIAVLCARVKEPKENDWKKLHLSR